MANNFHDTNGWLIAGIDLHLALLFPGIPFPLPPTPVPRMPHLTLAHPFTMGGNQKATVKFNGVSAVAFWHQPKRLWPHLNLVPFPIDILIPLYIVLGTQTAWLPRGTVLVEGEPASVANIYGPASINLDCWDWGDIPSSFVYQAGTVQTTPTLADYRMGATRFAIQIAINLVISGAFRFGGRAFGTAFRRSGLHSRFTSATNRLSDRFRNAISSRLPRLANWLNTPTNIGAGPFQRWLAGRPGSGPVQRYARQRVAFDYLRGTSSGVGRNGLPRLVNDFRTFQGAFDWNQPVRQVHATPGTHPNVFQYVAAENGVPEGHLGRWIDPHGGQTLDELGVNPDAQDLGIKAPVQLTTPSGGFNALEGTSAPIYDDWTTGTSTWTNGGGTQWFVNGADQGAIVANNPPPSLTPVPFP